MTASKNRATGSCDDVLESARNGIIFGGIGASAGTVVSGIFKGVGRVKYESLPLEVRLFLSSNAINGLTKNRYEAMGVTVGDSIGSVISNMPIGNGE